MGYPSVSLNSMNVFINYSILVFLILRETTLFPNIHGLNALIPLLFSPVAEMR